MNILVVNGDKDEGKTWRDKLLKEKLTVLPECTGFSDMVNHLMRERVHIVLFSASLVADNRVFSALKPAMEYFLKVKLVIVGNMEQQTSAFLLLKRTNGSIAKDFDSALRDYCKLFPPYVTKVETQIAQNVNFLLSDNFLSQEDAAVLLGPFRWSSGYVVIGIHADSYYIEVYRALSKEAAKQDFMVVQFQMDEFYAIIGESPTVQFATKLANDIRNRLFQETSAVFSIGISRIRHKAGELYASRREAARAFKATHLFGFNSIIHIDFLGSQNIEYLYPGHKEQKLIEAALDGDIDCAFAMLEDIFDVFESCKEIKQELINKIALKIIISLNTAATSWVFAFGKIDLGSQTLSKLVTATSIKEVHDHLKLAIEGFVKEMDDITEVTREALFYKLMAIKDAEKPISISDLSQLLNTTPAFINTAIYRNCNKDIFTFFKNGCVI
jgi:hypothetical protein